MQKEKMREKKKEKKMKKEKKKKKKKMIQTRPYTRLPLSRVVGQGQ